MQTLERHPGQPLLDEIRALRAWLRVRREDGSGVLFISSHGGQMNRSTFARLWRRLAQAASLPPVKWHPHVAKHTTGTLLARAGASAFLIRQHIGHRSILVAGLLHRERSGRERGRSGGVHASVELAPLADPALVPNSVAAALGIPERPNRPLTDTLADYLRTKKALLLFDGCEHLRAACQSLAEHLLHDPEPLPLEANPLRGMDNVVLTAHIGTETQEFDEACRRGAVENVVAFFEGRPRNVLAE